MSVSKKEFVEEARPLVRQIIDYAMGDEGQKNGITDVQVEIVSTHKHKISVEEGEVSEINAGQSSAVGVRLYAGDRSLSFSQNTLAFDDIKRAVDENMKVIHLVPENPDIRLLEPDKLYKGKPVDLDLYEEAEISPDRWAAYTKAMNDAALAVPQVKATRRTSLTRSFHHEFIMATNGLEVAQSESSYLALVSAVAEDQNGMQTESEVEIARYFSDLSRPEIVGETAARRAVAKLSPSLPSAGKTSIILSHEAAEAFFKVVYDALAGDEIYRETSFLKDKIGQQVMSADVTLVDDPRIPRGLSSQYVDSTGMETKEMTFIEKGVLKSYDVNLTEARQLGIDPIGRNEGYTNSTVLPGVKTPDDLMSDIQDGIYIHGFEGGSANVANGNHSRQAYGQRIKNGKITDEAVDGFVVAGKLQEMFMNVTLANDTPFHPSAAYRTIAAPTLRIDGVMISSAQ